MVAAADLLGDLLRDTSRSFYLSLTILPRPLREPIGLAYLLARAADTVADTRLIARTDRLTHLERLRAAYRGDSVDVTAVARACVPHQAHDAERRLLERLDEAIARVQALPPPDRAPVRAVLTTITSGMIFDLERFPGEDAATLTALETLDDLDRYTYLVAGCVGEFWTALHVAHRPRCQGWNVAEMCARGVRFGKALQMTNVLRDIPDDLRHGRCYVPARELDAVGLVAADLLEPSKSPRAHPLLARLVALTLEHYDVAWRYTLAIPRAEWRTRLACAWPLLIGLATLAAIAAARDPLARGPIKISRRAVRTILVRSTAAVWSDRALAREAARLRRRVSLLPPGAR
jgi:farnesyl-diphosphate farnesyltransferase